MKNYKAMKTAKSWSVKKAKVVDQAAVSEVTDSDGKVVRQAEAEQSHNELQLVRKQFDPSSGKALVISVALKMRYLDYKMNKLIWSN